MSKILSIVIPCYNKVNFTKACLKDLSQLSNDHEIIVIDNASTDQTKEELIKFNNIIYIRNEENIFHSGACNQGFRISSGKHVLFLNNDIRVKNRYHDWTNYLISACEENNALVGPTMGQLDNNFNFIKEANAQLSGNSYISGWCVAAKREVWNLLDIDGKGQIWNEKFPMYFNDGDLSFRARQKKIPLKVIHLPEVIHFGKISSAQINIHKLYAEGRSAFIKNWK